MHGHQHGFISGRSTVTNLAIISQYISHHLDNGGQIDVIYTDITNAFDTIDHSILLTKFSVFELKSEVLKTKVTFLSSTF